MSERRKSPVQPEAVEPEQCSIDLRLQILSGLPFFSDLSAEEVARINRLFVEQGYLPDEYIYFEGDPAERMYVLASGKVKILRHTSAGKNVGIDLLVPGEFFGSLAALGAETYPDSALAQTAICALSIGSDNFRKILETFPSITLKVLDTIAQRLHASQEMVRQLSVYRAERRIAYILLQLGDKLGRRQRGGVLIEVPLSREDLAEMTGTTTETASRIMSQFQKSGLVESGRQWIAITNFAGLEAIANPDSE